MTDTIFALSSGALPAAIAVVRISGPAAKAAIARLTDVVLVERHATLAWLRDPVSGERLDHALLLPFSAPRSVTGEDLIELHLHGGRAVVAGVLAALAAIDGLRAAEPGEFTRRAFLAGRMDLTEVEGLADLLQAETADQRRQALRVAEGGLSRLSETWRRHLLGLAARVEAAIDYAADDDETGLDEVALKTDLTAAAVELNALIAAPPAERLRDGIRVVLAGPPNAGKSTLLNRLIGRDAALVSPIAGTTRDRIEAPVVLGGLSFIFTDTAGLHDSVDPIEQLGIALATEAVRTADLILWLGDSAKVPPGAILVRSKADLAPSGPANAYQVSGMTGEGIPALIQAILSRALALVPAADTLSLNRRQRDLLGMAAEALADAAAEYDLVLIAAQLRQALSALDTLTGQSGVEDLLGEMFGRFCLGK